MSEADRKRPLIRFEDETSRIFSYRFTEELLEQTLQAPLNLYHDILSNSNNDSENERRPGVPRMVRMECSGTGNSSNSCNTICGNEKTLFYPKENLWNCLTLASLRQASIDYRDDGGPELTAEIEAEINANLNANLSFKSQPFNFTEFDATKVFEQFYNCSRTSCESDNNCKLSMDARNITDIKSFGLYPFLDKSFCANMVASPNNDIAGPGIYMSLLLQSALCLYIWIMSISFTVRTVIDPVAFWVKLVCNKFDISRTPKLLFTAEYPWVGQLLTRLEQSNFSHATKSFIADFSEAQSFYVIIVTVTIIYSRTQGAIFNGADNYPTLVLNKTIMASIIFYAFLPITIVQLSLRRTSMDSIYSLAFSTIAVILAGTASTLTTSPSAEDVWNTFSRVGTKLECGGTPSLRALCEGSTMKDHLFDVNISPLPIWCIWGCLAVMAYQWSLKLLWPCLSPLERPSFGSMLKKAKGNTMPPRHVALLLLRRMGPSVLLFGVQIALAYMMARSLREIISEVRESYKEGYNRPWNLGQVIALLVWVPVLAKYLYTIIFGVKSGFRTRLSKAFDIIKRPVDEDNRKSTTTTRQVAYTLPTTRLQRVRTAP